MVCPPQSSLFLPLTPHSKKRGRYTHLKPYLISEKNYVRSTWIILLVVVMVVLVVVIVFVYPIVVVVVVVVVLFTSLFVYGMEG